MIYVRAPNHLGDGVMARGAIAALRRLEPVVVAAPGWGGELYRDLDVEVVPVGRVPDASAGVLLPPSFRVAWEARRLPVRVGMRGQLRGPLLTHPVSPREEHRSEGYGRLAAVLGAPAVAAPRLHVEASDEVPEGHLAIAPLSPSGEPVMWPGFRRLAELSPWPVVVYHGPGECWPSPYATHADASLLRLAGKLRRARALVANDSGLSHLARALGLPTLVVHGSTAPMRTGALGSEAVEGPALACRPCYRKRCAVGGAPCLEIPAEQVLTSLHRLLQGAGPRGA